MMSVLQPSTFRFQMTSYREAGFGRNFAAAHCLTVQLPQGYLLNLHRWDYHTSTAHYKPENLVENRWVVGGYRYTFNGQEQENELNPSITSALHWMYDGRLGRRWNVDPIYKHYLSNYSVLANNPMLMIDPDGDDWYKDKKGSMQFDPKVNKDSKLKEGFTYVGQTFQVKDKAGDVTQDFRSDGSIFFKNETEAYNRIWNNTGDAKREQLGIIQENGVLVLPDYKNDAHTAQTKEYGYTFTADGSTFYDPVQKNSQKYIATIHAHKHLDPNPSVYDGTGSYGDLGFASRNTPNKPLIVMAHDGNVWYLISKGWNTDINKVRYQTTTFKKIGVDLDLNKLLTGYKFTDLLKRMQW